MNSVASFIEDDTYSNPVYDDVDPTVIKIFDNTFVCKKGSSILQEKKVVTAN